MHRALKFHKTIHLRHAVLDVELHLVRRVAVPRLLHGDVRRTLKNRDGAFLGVLWVDRVRLGTLEPVYMQRFLVAKEVVEGAVLLVQDHDVLDAVRTCRQC